MLVLAIAFGIFVIAVIAFVQGDHDAPGLFLLSGTVLFVLTVFSVAVTGLHFQPDQIEHFEPDEYFCVYDNGGFEAVARVDTRLYQTYDVEFGAPAVTVRIDHGNNTLLPEIDVSRTSVTVDECWFDVDGSAELGTGFVTEVHE